VLVQAAWAAVRKKECYYRSLFLRLRNRRGPKKAIVAVAAAILTAAFHILTDGTFYEDLGPNHFNRLDRARVSARLLRRLNSIGFDVQVRNVAA
jgi:hypothetical protein